MTITFALSAAPTPTFPAAASDRLGAVTTEISEALITTFRKASTVEPPEMCASIRFTSTLVESAPPIAHFPAPAMAAVPAVTTPTDEESKSTSSVKEVTTAPSM